MRMTSGLASERCSSSEGVRLRAMSAAAMQATRMPVCARRNKTERGIAYVRYLCDGRHRIHLVMTHDADTIILGAW